MTAERAGSSMDSFRYLEESGQLSSAEGLSGDEALASLLSENRILPTLRLYRYRPCVIVGRYQNLTDAVDLDACRRRGLEWNRRHSGGGTVLMGPDQLAVALVLPDARGRFIGSVREHFRMFAEVLARGLRSLGVEAGLAGKNDLQVDGRKIAGLAISQDIDGVVFFHASLLLDFDVSLMVEVLNLPTRDLDDRGQSCFSQRMTTVREHAAGVTFEAMKAALVRALEEGLEAEVRPAGWSPAEREVVDRIRRERYENDGWIYSSRVMREWTGTSDRKTAGGRLRVYVAGAGGTLDAVLITGDYFCRTADLARLESGLRGLPARREALESAIGTHPCDRIYRVDNQELAALILAAAEGNHV